MLRKLFEGSIRRQIALMTIGMLLLVTLLSALTEPFGIDDIEGAPPTRLTSVKLETVLAQVLASNSEGQVNAILEASTRSGLPVKKVPTDALTTPVNANDSRDFRFYVQRHLPSDIQSRVADLSVDGDTMDVLALVIDAKQSLAFQLSEPERVRWVSDTQIDIAWKALIVFTPVMILFYYVGNMIAGPLLRFAKHAEEIDPDRAPSRPFSEQGTHEIKVLAKSLNDMHQRVHHLVDQRTQMLRAISHDLRTPLTRLRLKAEKSKQPELRQAMVSDIQSLTSMIEEILGYLSRDATTEAELNVDLSSLIGTVCSGFEDMGHSVTFNAPATLPYVCRSRALTRAITNLIDNGTKFAKNVEVLLAKESNGEILISVSDDGPGIPVELRQNVLEPFFKMDSSRGSREGFGLGLSIVQEIVARHDGRLSLKDAKQGGLKAEIWLPAKPRSQFA